VLPPRLFKKGERKLPSCQRFSLFTERGREGGNMDQSSSAPRVPIADHELTAILKMHGFSATFFNSPLAALTAARLKAPELSHPTSQMPGMDAP
jgi:hypothetical protein